MKSMLMWAALLFLTLLAAPLHAVDGVIEINQVRANIRKVNPSAVVVDAASPIFVDDPNIIFGKRVLVIEDGPTLTHGEMKYGAGILAAQRAGVS